MKVGTVYLSAVGAITDPMDEAEEVQLRASYGADSDVRIKGQLRRSMESAAKELARRQKTRATRVLRDQVDRALLDLLGFYRDVLLVQLDARVRDVRQGPDGYLYLAVERDQQGGDRRTGCPERDVPEHIEDRMLLREREQEVIEHRAVTGFRGKRTSP